MPTGVFKITDIPEDKVENVIGVLEADIPEPEIATTEQENGLFTVTATYPDPGATTSEKFDPQKFRG